MERLPGGRRKNYPGPLRHAVQRRWRSLRDSGGRNSQPPAAAEECRDETDRVGPPAMQTGVIDPGTMPHAIGDRKGEHLLRRSSVDPW